METTNVQEFQRLNESISMCLEAVRRLVPQLAQAQQVMAQMTLPFGQGIAAGGYTHGVGNNPWAQTGYGYGQPVFVQPFWGQPGYGTQPTPYAPTAPTFVPYTPTAQPWHTGAQSWQPGIGQPFGFGGAIPFAHTMQSPGRV